MYTCCQVYKLHAKNPATALAASSYSANIKKYGFEQHVGGGEGAIATNFADDCTFFAENRDFV